MGQVVSATDIRLYDFRLQCIGLKAHEFARALLARLTHLEPANCLVRDIYDDDGRGTIRDFLLSEFSAGPYALEVIRVRADDAIVNFRLSTCPESGAALGRLGQSDVECRQRPWPPGQEYRLVGENTPWYLLRAPEAVADSLLDFFVCELEQCGMKGYLTMAERSLNDARLRYIREGKDPHLVIYRYRAIEYEKGRRNAMPYLDDMIDELPEFAPYLQELRLALECQR